MNKLSFTTSNVKIVQAFIDETKKRIKQNVNITFSRKAINELTELMFDYDINQNDIIQIILNLTPENYYRGIDDSLNSDFSVCAFRVFLKTKNNENIEIYLKYGIQINNLEILIFSNHKPKFPMKQIFEN